MFRNTETNAQPILTGWMIADSLQEQYSTDAGEERMLGDVEEGCKINSMSTH
jgi:hypothetical protein